MLQLFQRMLGDESHASHDRLLAGPSALAGAALGLDSAAAETASLLHSPLPVVHAPYWLTVNLTERRPLLLVVDDAHWADAPTLKFPD